MSEDMVRSRGGVGESASRREAIGRAMEPEEASQLLIREYGRMARAYDAYVAPYHAPIARRLVELAGIGANERILDIGCGTGIAAFVATSTVGSLGSVVGVDLAEEAVHLATERATAMGLRQIHFEIADSRALRFTAGSFDAVLSCFGHPLVGRDRCLAEVRRVLRPGGRAVLGTWNAAKPSAMPFREILEHRRPPVLAPDVDRLIQARKVLASTEEGRAAQSAAGWIAILEDAGLSSVQVLEETHRAVFRDPDAFLDYSFAWGDNERELRTMSPASRASLREEFWERVKSMVSEDGLIVDWPLRYFLVHA